MKQTFLSKNVKKKAFERLSVEQLVAWWNHYLPEKEEKEGFDLYYLHIFERGHPIRTDEAVSEKYNPQAFKINIS